MSHITEQAETWFAATLLKYALQIRPEKTIYRFKTYRDLIGHLKECARLWTALFKKENVPKPGLNHR